MKESDKGWAGLHPIIHKAYSSKGGKAKVKKGFAKMDPDRFKEVTSKGGKNKKLNAVQNKGRSSEAE